MRERNPGSPYPLGATLNENTWWNFSVYSPHRISQLVIGDYATGRAKETFPLDSALNRTGDIWHISIKASEDRLVWGWNVDHENVVRGTKIARLATDPYAKLLKTGNQWGENGWGSLAEDNGVLISVATAPHEFAWSTPSHSPLIPDHLIIYETHVRGCSEHPSSKSKNPGTYLGMIDTLPHLKSLGITAIEILPVFEFDESEWKLSNPVTGERLYNYWGYSPLSFFSPMQRYGTTSDPILTSEEFKRLIAAAHDFGIAVILDVVYNHTGEGNEHGPAYSFKVLDESAYYILDKNASFTNYSGCGNTLNANHPIVIDLILSSLRHWAIEYRIDGFRFDLASAMTRNQEGVPMVEPSVIEAIVKDPVISKCMLIAEPWDAAGLYQAGSLFSLNQCHENAFMEWNDRFRDDVRKFIRGTPGTSGLFASRLCGSKDIYGRKGFPKNSINYIVAHDGFSLFDLVSYNMKHNLENGEHNRDGMNENFSWNCGEEGPSDHRHINRLRDRQLKNFIVALFLAQGTPMMLMGDECRRSKKGNNNTWCQDSPLSWLNWDEIGSNRDCSRLISTLITLRTETGCFHSDRFLSSDDIQWHGNTLYAPNWDEKNQFVAFSLLKEEKEPCLFIAFNASSVEQSVEIPPLSSGSWHLVVHTSKSAPNDMYCPNKGPKVISHALKMRAHSSLVLIASAK